MQTGDRERMYRGLGHYVQRGLGGTTWATRRLSRTAQTAGTLFSVLARAAEGQPLPPTPDPDVTARIRDASSADEVMDALVEVVEPIDGTQDAEASRKSVRDALAEVLQAHPDANLLELTAPQRHLAIERFLANNVFRRFQLDVGKSFQAKAADATSALAALKEVKNYIAQTISAKFRELTQEGRALTGPMVADLAAQTLTDTFDVFKEYSP